MIRNQLLSGDAEQRSNTENGHGPNGVACASQGSCSWSCFIDRMMHTSWVHKLIPVGGSKIGKYPQNRHHGCGQRHVISQLVREAAIHWALTWTSIFALETNSLTLRPVSARKECPSGGVRLFPGGYSLLYLGHLSSSEHWITYQSSTGNGHPNASKPVSVISTSSLPLIQALFFME